jgi:hypothetical protein
MTLLGKIRDAVAIYIFWITLHAISVKLYSQYCVGTNLLSILLSPLAVQLPYCIGIRWIIVKGAQVIDLMWIILGKWLIEKIMEYRLYNVNEIGDDSNQDK